jgi:hypothetical protein
MAFDQRTDLKITLAFGCRRRPWAENSAGSITTVRHVALTGHSGAFAMKTKGSGKREKFLMEKEAD